MDESSRWQAIASVPEGLVGRVPLRTPPGVVIRRVILGMRNPCGRATLVLLY
jgi:hypothetical protein